MAISQKLAEEMITIVGFHLMAVLLLSGIAYFIWLKSRRGPLLNGYLCVVAAFLIWMIAKIFKTVAPTIELRWLFIVIQYVGINFLGIALIAFAYAYSKDRALPRRLWLWLAIPPAISMSIMATNPWHHLFYSYFDFYKDRFGAVFYPTQAVQYVYWILGIVLLARNFTHQPAFKGRRGWANFFTAITLIPILANLYYILFKLGVFKWIFPFRVFDITPIFGTLALVLFTLPALRYRFFDISPYTHQVLFQQLEQGFVIFSEADDGAIESCNPFAQAHFTQEELLGLSRQCLAAASGLSLGQPVASRPVQIQHRDGRSYEVQRVQLEDVKKRRALWFTGHAGKGLLLLRDVTEQSQRIAVVEAQNQSLRIAQTHLQELEAKIQEIGSARAKSQVAQSVHDILGHSLTLAIGAAELAALQCSEEGLRTKRHQIQEILHRGLAELKSSIADGGHRWQETTLLKAMSRLDNESLRVALEVQGMPTELSPPCSEALYRLAQEAITNARKHGDATQINFILRFQRDGIMLFAIDNGRGCGEISESMGLSGIRNRLTALGGQVAFYSDGEQGFTIKAQLPIAAT